MSRRDAIWGGAVFILIGAIFFLLSKREAGEENFFIGGLSEDVKIISREGKEERLKAILESSQKTEVLFFEISNCGGCIEKGIREIAGLKKEGKRAFLVLVHNWYEDFRSWAKNYYEELKCYYMLERKIFRNKFNAEYLPLLVSFSRGKFVKKRFIIP